MLCSLAFPVVCLKQLVPVIVPATAAINFFPFLDRLPGDVCNVKKVLSNNKFVEDAFLRPQIERHMKTYNEDTVTDFIHAYIRQMKRLQQEGKDTSLDGGWV